MWQLTSLSKYINPSKKKQWVGSEKQVLEKHFCQCVQIMKKYEHSSPKRSHLMALTR